MNKYHYFDGAKLMPREHVTLGFLSLGMPVKEIAQKLKVKEGHARIIIVRLCAKTGILDRKDMAVCQGVLNACTDVRPPRKRQERTQLVTQMQSAVLLEISKGKLFYDAAKVLGISHSTAKKHFIAGIARLGFTGLRGSTLRAALAEYFTSIDNQSACMTMDDPAFN